MDSVHNDTYEIREEFGFFGVSIYFNIQCNCLLSKKLQIIPENFDLIIIKFYFNQFKNSTAEAISLITELIKSFPSNGNINELIKKNLLQKKEFFLIKLILDLKLHFYIFVDKLKFKSLKQSIRTMQKFYTTIENEDLRKFSEKINKNKILEDIYRDNFLMNFKKKSEYKNELKKIKNDNNDLLSGISLNKFEM